MDVLIIFTNQITHRILGLNNVRMHRLRKPCLLKSDSILFFLLKHLTILGKFKSKLHQGSSCMCGYKNVIGEENEVEVMTFHVIRT